LCNPAYSGPFLNLLPGRQTSFGRKLVHRVRCGLQLKRNGKPYKELVKIAHPPINCRRNLLL
jgi:hypothetical protein